MRYRRVIIALLFAISIGSAPVAAAELEQESDIVYLDEGIIDSESRYGEDPARMEVTCYIEAGKRTCTGSSRMEGLIASNPDWIGRVASIYKVAEDGGLGDFVGYYEILDIGYGKSTHSDVPSIFDGRRCAGTIETGLCIDVREPTYSKCVDFMTETFVGGKVSSTGSAVYVVINDGEG